MRDTIEVKAARAVVRGIVQGVFFRQSTVEQAQARSLAGWVRNLPDGSVELYVEGPAHDVEALLRWCRRGPTSATVEDVEIEWKPMSGMSPPFRVRH
jgi:acylphosphatase